MALIDCHFFSQVLGQMATMSVMLPDPGPLEAGVAPRIPLTRYPTLYLLHGLSDDQTAWQRRTSIERYVEGLNLAVVMPAVHGAFTPTWLLANAIGLYEIVRSCLHDHSSL